MNLFKRFSRYIYVILALSLGFFVVYGLSMVSEKSKGPIETVLTKAGSTVQEVEKTIILDQREGTREDKLAWFKNIRYQKEKLVHSKIILFGASDDSKKESYENIINLEDSLALTFPIIHIYQAWGEKDEQQFPIKEVNAIDEIGSVPMITWEPWVSDFNVEDFPGIPAVEQRDKGAFTQVANGLYDAFLSKWAQSAKDYGHPIYLRLGHEMNEPYRYPWGPQNVTPQEFVAGWKHVHDLFNKIGAKNIIWVWSPHTAYGYFDDYYPGNEYVDMVSTGILNFGTSTNWSKWWTFAEIFGSHYKELASYKKPMMIAEFGCLKPGGDRAKWFGDALRNFQKNYPLVNSIVFFHYSGDKTTTDKSVNWYIKDDKKVTSKIKETLKTWDASIKQPKN
ncbi:glycoside hydrolase family 26 protein [Flavobacterium aciduliphilum]|uniref:Glycosyl hydrolase family 26 n=1 Tax=Flavobacterium aciduliphilum TaxID=1101402 RepID=A0A328YMS1_9FLAO|nr:glycosyl hydrolase [Flavobacterium aciduliphilum]RAR75418.1 glycosyl hydrolase family 26 [Flavobacterium aciduliphilum]